LLLASCLLSTSAEALDIKLWPLIDYHSEPSGRALHLLGPLFSYESGPEREQWTLRPLFSFTRAHERECRRERGHQASQNQFALLYPLFVARWEADLADYRLFGLIRYWTQPAEQDQDWDSRFTVFPFFFYRHSRTRGTTLSVLPFYADVHDFFGYRRVTMIAFPLYLRLEEPLVHRTWLPFPFVSWAGGPLGRGWRVFPLYGWDEEGDSERFRYVLWPFYIAHERHFARPERERRLVLFPFYASIDSAATQSRSFIGPFFTHTIDRKAGTDTWGFPWPLWLSQRRLDTGERTTLRIAPFYEDALTGDLHSHFIMWPAYRWETQEVEGTEPYRHTRSDAFLVVYRSIDEEQPARGHHRHLQTLFPLFRASGADRHEEWSTPALFDALLPRNPTIGDVYAPLWRLYTQRTDGDGPRHWSLLWDLISSDGTQVRYPVHLDFSE
jgi:hypothetical protein